MKPIIVMKFGGASLATAERILSCAQLVKDANKENTVVVVVSALQTVTDSLIAIWQIYQQKQVQNMFEKLRHLYDLHMHVLKNIHLSHEEFLQYEKALNSLFGQLMVHVTMRKENSLEDYDFIVSFGERLSAYLLSAALQKMDALSSVVDSSECIVTSEDFGNAHVFFLETQVSSRKIVYSLIEQHRIPVITGFFGATRQKKVAILGRGGSDYSATILAHVLDAKEVILWKEVDGVFCSDPKKNPNAQFFRELSYEKALSLAENGAKILHKEAMNPVKEKSIPVLVKNVFRPECSGTKIWEGAYENA